MNVVIAEDEKLTARRLENLLREYDPTIQVLTVLPSVAKGIAWFADRAQQGLLPPDLLFLDIHLEDDSGFKLIERAGLTLPVIFTTAYDQYTLQAFKTNSIDYLLKPIDEAELRAALDKFKRMKSERAPTSLPDVHVLLQTLKTAHTSYKERFMVTVGTKIRSISTTDIAYVFSEDRATWLTTRDGQHVNVEYSLDKLTILLDPARFFRVNRAFMVALDAIRTIHSYSGSKLKLELQPAPKQEVFVSLHRMTEFKEWLGK